MVANPPLIDAAHLRMDYPSGVAALDGVTLQVEAGQFVAIVGPSGCGKSTLLRLLSGLLQATSGRVSIAGEPPAKARRQAAPMSFVFQDPTLLPWRSVADNVRLPLELLGDKRPDLGQVMQSALELVGLADFSAAYPAQLSGGMRMRVSLARALVTQPRLMLLDEPFAALDDITRSQLNEDLLALWRRSSWTGVFVTHNIAEAVFLSQRVLVMGPRPGRVIADVPVPFAWPRTSELRATAEFAQLTGQLSERLREACK